MSLRFASLTVSIAMALSFSACSRPSGHGNGACQRIVGMWRGDGITATDGRDPEAVRVVDEVMREEQWRITRVTDTGLQRERVGAAGGRPVAEAMFVTSETPTTCAVQIRDRDQHTREVRFDVRGDGRVDVTASDAWYVLHLRHR